MRIPALLLVSVCTFSVLMGPVTAQQRQHAPLAVRDALLEFALTPLPPSLSSDNQLIAFTVTDPNRARFFSDKQHQWVSPSGVPPTFIGCDIWLTDLKDGKTRNLTQGKGNNWAPNWSPDNRYLAFFSDRTGQATLWVWDKRSGLFRRISDVVIFGYQGLSIPRWTPDSRKVLVSALPQGTTIEEAAVLTVGGQKNRRHQHPATDSMVTVFGLPESSSEPTPARTQSLGAFDTYINGYIADLALVDIETGYGRRLIRRDKPCGYWPSPNGTHLAFTRVRNHLRGQVYDLVTISLRDGRAKVLAENLQQGFVGLAVSWSPDGKTLGYTTYEAATGSTGSRNCYLVSVDEAKPQRVTNGPQLGFSQPFRPPLWDATGKWLYLVAANSIWRISAADSEARQVAFIPNRTITDIVASTEAGRFWSPDDGRSLFVSTLDAESLRVGFSKVDVKTGEVSKLVEENKVYAGNNGLLPTGLGAPNGNTFLYLAEDTAHSSDFWCADPNFLNVRRITRINPQFDEYSMGTASLIEWPGPDGKRLRGALLLPPNYQPGKTYPLIVRVYPDAALSGQLNLFGFKFNGAVDAVNNKQLLATRGYAVLLADSRTQVGTQMKDIVNSVMPGVDKVIEMGIADPSRLGVMGFSHGGYAVLSLIVQTTRFRAAIDWAGFGNLISMYGQMDPNGRDHWHSWAEVFGAKMGGTPWQFRERYIQNSPIFFLDKVQTPLLIVQGNADNITPPFLADEIFVALRRLDKEVVYAKYEGEDHGFRNYASKFDYCNRMIGWFDKWLNVRAETGKN